MTILDDNKDGSIRSESKLTQISSFESDATDVSISKAGNSIPKVGNSIPKMGNSILKVENSILKVEKSSP